MDGYQRMVDVCEQVVGRALDGADAEELVTVLSQVVGRPVVLLQPDLSLRVAHDAGHRSQGRLWRDPQDPRIRAVLRSLAGARRPLRIPAAPGSVLSRGCVATPVAVGEQVLGHLLVLGSDGPDEVDLVTVGYAAAMFALALAHERSTSTVGVRHRASLLEQLVAGASTDATDAADRARQLGLTDGFRLAVCRPVPPPSPVGPGVTLPALRRDDDAVVALPAGEQPSVLGAWCAGIVGLSAPVEHPELAPSALRQAELAADVAARLGRQGRPLCYERLGVHRLLAEVGDPAVLWAFADDTLGTVVGYDASHRQDLLHTLSVYLDHHGSHKQSAVELCVHQNTVAYRVARIEALSGLHLDEAEDRLTAHLAVRIIEARRGA